MQYAAAERCIYCGQTGTPDEALGEEHIVPQSFGGTLVLPKASCRRCESVTSLIETHCMLEMISTARPHLRLRGRQKSNFDQKGPVYFQKGPFVGVKSVPIDEHPGALIVPALNVARGLRNTSFPKTTNYNIPPARLMFRKSMTPDVAQRAWKIDPSGLSFNKQGLSLIQFYRFLAKIAHSYTAAELGLTSFSPTLINMIFGLHPFDVEYFVGSEPHERAASPPNHLHELSFSRSLMTKHTELIVVKIRLFANLGAPTHYVISGVRFR